ncbi:MAG TPA: hypothetical protein VKM94_04720 [Blastocatellia bacterium]|nr:hypothetical protein [Blastocatellia bacterium]
MKTSTPNKDDFEALLAWLNPDRDAAAETYLRIQSKLIQILVRRQCYEAAELADEVFNRVTNVINRIAPTYTGDPARYFFGVLRKVYQEWLRDEGKRLKAESVVPSKRDHNLELNHSCLEQCLDHLNLERRDLIVEYHRHDKRKKIENRERLAHELGVTLNTLRMRIHRITESLEKCFADCLDREGAGENVVMFSPDQP